MRHRLRGAALVLGASWLLAFAFAQELMALLAQPLISAWEAHRATLGAPRLHFSSLVSPFWASMNVAFWAALLVAAPILLQQIMRVVVRARAPGRPDRSVAFAITSFACFAGGALFCYFVVLPVGFDFFLGYADKNLADMASALGVDYRIASPVALRPALFVDEYLSLTIRLLLAFGLVFELPLAIYFLAAIGLVTHRGLWKFNRWAAVLCFVAGAVLTPSPDVLSQVLMAVPLLVLYNLSIVIAWSVTRRRAAAEQAGP